MNTVSFPNLGIGPFTFYPYLNILGLHIYWYGIIIAIGAALAFLFATLHAEEFGIIKSRMTDVVLIGILGGIIGARLYYVLFSWSSFSDHPLSIFNLRTGGLAIYGGIIGALICGVIACKYKKTPLLPMLDLTGMGLLIGQGIGRWGNFINVEAYGCHTDLPWAMAGSGIPPSISPVHPTFLYESIWCLLGFFLLRSYIKKRKFDGELFLLYLVWYGLERFFVEGLRMDSLWLVSGVVRVSQLLSAVLFILGICLLVRNYIYIKKDPGKARLYVHTAAWQNDLQTEGKEK